MSDYVTRSGLVVTDRRHVRASEWHGTDGRGVPPNANGPRTGSHETATSGYGDSHVMYPADNPPFEASYWDGWPVEWATPPMEPGNPWEYSGYGYGRQNGMSGYGSAAKVSTVMTCVDLNSRTLGTMPPYAVSGFDTLALPEWSSSPEPDLYSDWSEFAKLIVNCLQLRGEAIIYALARDPYTDLPVRFVALNPELVEVEMYDGRVRYALGELELERRDICHIKYQAWPTSVRGIGPLEWAARSVVSAAALEKYGSELASRGGVPWAVLKHPQNLNKKQRDDLKSGWVAARAQGGTAPAILHGGVELEPLTISPKDMALLDLRVFDEQRIAAALGVPPFLVGLPQPGGMTYTNAESLFDFHWRATLRPMAQTIASAMSRFALPRGVRMEFNRDEYVRPGLGERAQAYSVLANIRQTDESGVWRNAMSIDEIRMSERLRPYATPPRTADTANMSGAAVTL